MCYICAYIYMFICVYCNTRVVHADQTAVEFVFGLPVTNGCDFNAYSPLCILYVADGFVYYIVKHTRRYVQVVWLRRCFCKKCDMEFGYRWVLLHPVRVHIFVSTSSCTIPEQQPCKHLFSTMASS